MIRCRTSLCFAILAVHLLPAPLEAQTKGPSINAKIEIGPDGRPAMVRGGERIPAYILYIVFNCFPWVVSGVEPSPTSFQHRTVR